MPDIRKIADKIQAEIMAEVRKKYSIKVIENWQHPKNWGIMNNPDGYGKITGPCGDMMEISIRVKANTIAKCTFDTDGCGTTIACGSIITEMAAGKSIRQAKLITQETVLRFCGGLPEEDRHCALLAVNTLQEAIRDYEGTQDEPWKKLYRKV